MVLLRLTDVFTEKRTFKENVLSPFAFVGSTEGLVQMAKAGFDEVKSSHSIGTKVNTGTKN